MNLGLYIRVQILANTFVGNVCKGVEQRGNIFSYSLPRKKRAKSLQWRVSLIYIAPYVYKQTNTEHNATSNTIAVLCVAKHIQGSCTNTCLTSNMRTAGNV